MDPRAYIRCPRASAKARSGMGCGLLLSLAALLAACSMADSQLMLETQAIGCRSGGGSYSLPKSYVAFEVYFTPIGSDPRIGNVSIRLPREYTTTYSTPVTSGNQITTTVTSSLINPAPGVDPASGGNSGVAIIPKPDPERTYCLDYLRSVTSNDTFIVNRNNSLLTQITTSADDKSTEIVSALIQTAFAGISQNPDFPNFGRAAGVPSLGTALKFSGMYDPFDLREVAQVNDAIKRYGLCLFLDGEPIDPLQDDVGAYCEDPLGWRPPTAWLARTRKAGHYVSEVDVDRRLKYAGENAAPRRHSQGIFYRPRLPFTFYLYAKENLKLKNVRGAWKMRGSQTVLLENVAPIFSVGVDRTFFAKRDTTLVFDQGVLKDITITKGSELANAATIPLQIAQSVAALPAQVVKVKIDQNDNRAKLITAQAQLIAAQRMYLNDQKELSNVPPAAATPLASSPGANAALSQCVINCLNTGQGQDTPTCQKACNGG